MGFLWSVYAKQMQRQNAPYMGPLDSGDTMTKEAFFNPFLEGERSSEDHKEVEIKNPGVTPAG